MNFCFIEEGFIQKARQTAVVSVWGTRSNATLGIFGLNVWFVYSYIVDFPFTFVVGRGDVLCIFVFKV